MILSNINKLVIASDIDQETFDEKIHKITDINELHIPRSLSKLKILSKAARIKKVVEYE